MNHRVRAGVFGVIVAISSCARTDTLVVRGEYFYNFENASLTPDGKEECWEVKGDMSSAEFGGNGTSRPWGISNVVVRGALSAPGKYGNMGRCTREISVTEVISAENIKQGP